MCVTGLDGSISRQPQRVWGGEGGGRGGGCVAIGAQSVRARAPRLETVAEVKVLSPLLFGL